MNPLKVEILGTGCKKCQQLEANAKAAIATLNLAAEVLHSTDSIEIARRGVLSTPAFMVNSRVIGKGKVMSSEEIQAFLQM